MSELDLIELRKQLLARRMQGELDQPTYERMLADLDKIEDSSRRRAEGEAASRTPVPSAALVDTPTAQYDSMSGPTSPRDAENAPSLAPGVMLAHYRIESQLGKGGMGEVWKAYDTSGERHVVVKVLPAALLGSREEMARVKETFRHIHALQHEHICPVYVLGEDPRYGAYLVMKYLDAVTLSVYRAAVVKKYGRFPLKELARVLQPVAAALDYAHAKRVIHRDIKPQNLMISRDSRDVQVVDFGLAAEIRTSMTRVSQVQMDTSGTYPYMAPEQWRGAYQDGKTDQYALAVVAYELYAGQLPYAVADWRLLMRCVLEEPVSRPEEMPEGMYAVLARAMAKDRGERFKHCEEFIAALAKAGQEEQAAQPLSPSSAAPSEAAAIAAPPSVPLPPAPVALVAAPADSAPPNSGRMVEENLSQSVAREAHQRMLLDRLTTLVGLQRKQELASHPALAPILIGFNAMVFLLLMLFLGLWLIPDDYQLRGRIASQYDVSTSGWHSYQVESPAGWFSVDFSSPPTPEERSAAELRLASADMAVRSQIGNAWGIYWVIVVGSLAAVVISLLVTLIRRLPEYRSQLNARIDAEIAGIDQEFPADSAQWGGADFLRKSAAARSLLWKLATGWNQVGHVVNGRRRWAAGLAFLLQPFAVHAWMSNGWLWGMLQTSIYLAIFYIPAVIAGSIEARDEFLDAQMTMVTMGFILAWMFWIGVFTSLWIVTKTDEKYMRQYIVRMN